MILVFSYRKDKIPNLPVIDCRGMHNPYPDTTMTDEEKIASIRNDPLFSVYVAAALAVLSVSQDVAIGCTHGKHRSVAVARAVLECTATYQFIVYGDAKL